MKAASRAAFAAKPLERSRTARINLDASRRTQCFAAPKPRPVLEPVIIIVWDDKEVVGMGRERKSWE